MKLHPVLLAILPIVFSHCGPAGGSPGRSPSEPASFPGLPPGHKPYEGPHQATYQLGLEQGRTDGASGKSRQPSRHYGTFPATQTDAFNRGYQAGYSLMTRQTVPPQVPGGMAAPAVPARPAGTAPAAVGPLTAFRSPGKVTLRRNGRIVSVCYTAMPRVERARFLDDHRKIVIRSRADPGPATVQLFDTITGEELARVMSHQIQGGLPSWAAGMAN